MAAPNDRPYRHLGVFFPPLTLTDDAQWSSEENIERDGFIFLQHIQGYIFFLQSVSTGDVFVNKVFLPDEADGPDFVPEELRFSTAPRADRRLPKSCMVRNRERIYFIEMVHWQDFYFGSYSLYFKYYNGGSLDAFMRRYRGSSREVPEHFIWHVLLTLIEAVRYLKFGALPGTDDEDPTWIPIHHRDIALRNVFIHYLPHDDPEPDEGFEENAFPEIILGDFGHAAVEQDDEHVTIRPGCWDESGVIADWHDTYSIFTIVRELCAQTGEGLARLINEVLHPDERPFSDELVTMLELFEYPNFQNDVNIKDSQRDPVTGLETPNYMHIPDVRQVMDELLPIARDRVQRYRNPAGGIPDGWWKQLDVSWTKPDPFMPYEWMTQGLPNANDVENHGDKGKGKEDEGGDNDKENEKPTESHYCPTPNPESVRESLVPVRELEEEFVERPRHIIVHLDYGQPIMTEIRQAPPPPGPAMPDPPPLGAS